jgi:cation:H+ antiporter
MQDFPLWLNAMLFALGGAVIWWAGTQLEHITAEIARRVGLGEAFSGMLLLAVATSLPELATTATAVILLDDIELAVHNLLGGVALQTGLIAVADACKRGRGALTYFSPDFALLIQGVGVILLLQITLAGVAAGGAPVVSSVSAWSGLLLVAYLSLAFIVYRSRNRPRWVPADLDVVRDQSPAEGGKDDSGSAMRHQFWVRFVLLSCAVLGGGWLAAGTADVLADQTGLGSAFLGATFLALATSLPEVSTTISAVRNERYTAAISNIFGSNAFDVTLLALADVLYRGGAVLASGGRSVNFVCSVGAAMTCVYLWGLMERRNRTLFGVGLDSVAVVVLYFGSMAVLYVIQ